MRPTRVVVRAAVLLACAAFAASGTGRPAKAVVILPVAVDDSYVVQAGTDLLEFAPGLLANDFPDPASLSILNWEPAADSGICTTMVSHADGYFECQVGAAPATGHVALYDVKDSLNQVSTNYATVDVKVVPPAVANADDGGYALEGSTFTLPAPGVLANDTPGNGGQLYPIWIVDANYELCGTGSAFGSDGSVICKLPPGVTGSFVLTYQDVEAGVINGYSGTTSLTIRILPPTVPNAPTSVTASPATPTSHDAHVSWSAPTGAFLPAVSGYTATASPGGQSCTTVGATSCNITGLPDGAYKVSVVATNSIGDSVASASSSSFRIDTSAPTISAPTAAFTVGSTLGTTTTPVKLSWSGTDPSGIGHYDLALSTNGNAPVALTLPTATSTSLTRSFSIGSNIYQLSLDAADTRGNASSVVQSVPFRVARIEDTNSTVHYGGSWSKVSSSSASGGSLHDTHTNGAYATYSFTGRAFAWVAAKGSTKGSAKVYVDGVYVQTVSLYASATQARRIVFARLWSSSGSHIVKIVCLATSGHPHVDLDAILLLR